MLFTENYLRHLGSTRVTKAYASANQQFQLEEAAAVRVQSFDVFLSHSIKDAEIIAGIKTVLEKQGLSVYVDWIVDDDLDRGLVSPTTAERLRIRMKQSKSLIYAHSNNSPGSKWMPWELGFFDGYRGVIAIFPVAKSENEPFKGQEFLGLYPYIDTVSNASLFVNKGLAPNTSLGTGASHLGFKDWMRQRAGVAA